MTSGCIHGVPVEQCASCRSCPHGLTISRCGRCREAAARTKPPAPTEQPSEQYEGYEIFFVPAHNSWYYRTQEPDASPSRLSFGSAFQARRGVDAALSAPPELPHGGHGKKKKRGK